MLSMSVTLDVERFSRRLKALYASWREDGGWGNAKAVAIVTGTAAEAIRYLKSSSLHLWLLGYEFTGKDAAARLASMAASTVPHSLLTPPCVAVPCCADTVLVFTPTEVHALAGSKKTDILSQLQTACQDAGLSLQLHTKPKKEDGTQQMQELLDVLKGCATPALIGTLPKVGRYRLVVPAEASLVGRSANTLLAVSLRAGKASWRICCSLAQRHGAVQSADHRCGFWAGGRHVAQGRGGG